MEKEEVRGSGSSRVRSYLPIRQAAYATANRARARVEKSKNISRCACSGVRGCLPARGDEGCSQLQSGQGFRSVSLFQLLRSRSAAGARVSTCESWSSHVQATPVQGRRTSYSKLHGGVGLMLIRKRTFRCTPALRGLPSKAPSSSPSTGNGKPVWERELRIEEGALTNLPYSVL